MTMNYLVYENDNLLAGFKNFDIAMTFIEKYRVYSPIRMDLVDGKTAEVLDTWQYGKWDSCD